jgi:hypothetical protein
VTMEHNCHHSVGPACHTLRTLTGDDKFFAMRFSFALTRDRAKSAIKTGDDLSHQFRVFASDSRYVDISGSIKVLFAFNEYRPYQVSREYWGHSCPVSITPGRKGVCLRDAVKVHDVAFLPWELAVKGIDIWRYFAMVLEADSLPYVSVMFSLFKGYSHELESKIKLTAEANFGPINPSIYFSKSSDACQLSYAAGDELYLRKLTVLSKYNGLLGKVVDYDFAKKKYRISVSQGRKSFIISVIEDKLTQSYAEAKGCHI